MRVAQGRPRRGERAAYDLEAKTVCYLIGISFVRCGGAYRAVYDERKAHLTDTHRDWPPKRVHLAAVRATVKRFLADLWVAWRVAEGYPAATPRPACEPGDMESFSSARDVSDPKLEESP